MAWTRETILDEARARADERHLIEAISDITADPAIVSLIDEWFAIVEEEGQ